MRETRADQHETRLARGLTVRQALTVTTLAGAKVLAGASGVDRVIERLNVMEVPDILPWVKPHEFLLTTAYPLREVPGALPELVSQLDARGLAGLGIKVGRYIDVLPTEMLRRADGLGFPVVQLPGGVGFDDILNEVLTSILNSQAAALARSEAIHRALVQIVLTGGDLPEIAHDVSDLLGGPTLITDADGRIVAHARTDDLAAPLAAADLLPVGARPLPAHPAERRELLERHAIRHLEVPISAGTRGHGHILALEATRPLDEEDRIALENAATVAALAITKSLAVAAVEGKFASDLLHDLLAGRVRTLDEAVGRGASLGWDLARPVVVLVVAADTTSGQEDPSRVHARMADRLREAVRGMDRHAGVVALSREVVVLAGGANDGTAERAHSCALATRLHRAAGAATGLPVAVGVSRPAEDALTIRDAHAQATTALRMSGHVPARAGVVHFDELGAFRLLGLVQEQAELRAFAREALGPLVGDDPEAEDLRRTLDVLLATNLNVAEAARRLHFHYNTLRYRLDKLEGLLGPFSTDPQIRLNLLLALQIVQMHGAAA